MSLRKSHIRMTVDEYLESEKTSPVRSEYLDGEVYAMSGASRRHNRITINLCTQLSSRLRGGPCEIFVTEVKLRIETLNYFYYPDLVVTCDPEDNDDYFVTRPVLVVEVESPSTAAIDRREKLMAYRKLESLKEYLMLAQDSVRADLFRREANGEWSREQLEGDQELRLESIDLNLRLSDLYEDVELPV
jgi:Uma2 family endonuclease